MKSPSPNKDPISNMHNETSDTKDIGEVKFNAENELLLPEPLLSSNHELANLTTNTGHDLIQEPAESIKFQTSVNSIPCSECDCFFYNSEALARHKSSRHAKHVNKLKCMICGAHLRTIRTLRKHSLLHQRKNQSLQNGTSDGGACPVCKAWFRSKRSLSSHKRVHASLVQAKKKKKKGTPLLNKRNGTCFLCPHEGCAYASSSKSILKRHYSNVHLGIRRFACTIDGCNHKSGTKYDLFLHQCGAHNALVSSENREDPKADN